MAADDDVTLLDALDVFAETLDEMMGERGLDRRKCTKEEQRRIVAECFFMQAKCYEEYVLWAIYGDDTKAKTMAIIRADRARRQ